jgi:hypothetical protein
MLLVDLCITSLIAPTLQWLHAKKHNMTPFFSEHGTNSKKVVYINLGFQFLKVYGDRLNLP